MKRQIPFLAGLLAGFIAGISPAVAVTANDLLPYDGRVAFEIKRDDRSLGWHRISFTREGDRLIVDIALDLEFKLGFLTLYKYAHRNQEIWENGELISIETRTNDDGTPWHAEGERVADGFYIRTGIDGGKLVPAPFFPTSYWDRRFTQQDIVLGTQKGVIRDISVTAKDQTFLIRKGLNLDLDYDDQGHWLGGIATTKDGQIAWVPGMPPEDGDRNWWAYGLDDLPLDKLDPESNNQLAFGSER